MATRKYKSRAGKRKSYRKRTYKRKSNRAVYAISRGGYGQLPVPNRMIVKMRYSDQATLDANSISASTYTYTLNGLYDPDISGSGHQPMGFDQFSGLYQQYKVLGAKVTIEACGPPVTTLSEQYIGIQFHENASYAPANIVQIIERGRERHAVLGGQNNKTRLTMFWSAKKWYGKINYSGFTTAGTISANPTELAYVSAFVTRAENGENPDPMTYVITIDYIVEWFGPLQMSQS